MTDKISAMLAVFQAFSDSQDTIQMKVVDEIKDLEDGNLVVGCRVTFVMDPTFIAIYAPERSGEDVILFAYPADDASFTTSLALQLSEAVRQLDPEIKTSLAGVCAAEWEPSGKFSSITMEPERVYEIANNSRMRASVDIVGEETQPQAS